MTIERAMARLHGALDGEVSAGEPMARHTTYRIGGPAARGNFAGPLGYRSRVMVAPPSSSLQLGWTGRELVAWWDREDTSG